MTFIPNTGDDAEAQRILDEMYPSAPRPSTNPFYVPELARPDSELNRTGLRKPAPEPKTRDELIAQGIAAGRIIDLRRKV